MPPETEFANSFEDAQLDVERREQNAKKRRTMSMWRNAVEHTWDTRPMSEIRKLIDRQPKVMQAIIDCEGGRTEYWDIKSLNNCTSSFYPTITFYANRGIQGKSNLHLPKSLEQPPQNSDFKSKQNQDFRQKRV